MLYRACAPTTSDGAINELLRSWGRDIADARQTMGLSQSACATCLFLNEDTVRRIELGDPRIGLGAFVSVLWALGLMDALEGPLAPVEQEERPVFLPALILPWQVSKLPVPVKSPGLPDLDDEPFTPSGPRWPIELWALEDRLIIGELWRFDPSAADETVCETPHDEGLVADFEFQRMLEACLSEPEADIRETLLAAYGDAAEETLAGVWADDAAEPTEVACEGLLSRFLRGIKRSFGKTKPEQKAKKVA
ncbi:hypothetical protein [Roseibium sp.]|uniref:hypothetical protein n=1 Tax=Roseibium sp. TaxID=1936156 RepID=UPI003A96FF4F